LVFLIYFMKSAYSFLKKLLIWTKDSGLVYVYWVNLAFQ